MTKKFNLKDQNASTQDSTACSGIYIKFTFDFKFTHCSLKRKHDIHPKRMYSIEKYVSYIFLIISINFY